MHSATYDRINPLKLRELALFSWCLNHGDAMFFRTKKSGTRSYLQIVENRWEDGRPRQRVITTLGRLDQLQQTGQLDALLASGARLAQSVLLLSAHAKGKLPLITTRRIGPALIFERLWEQTGCRHVVEQLLGERVAVVDALDVAAGTRVAIPEPRAPHPAAPLEHARREYRVAGVE